MNACASLQAKSVSSVRQVPQPIVFVEGSPWPDLVVLDYQSQGPTDRRLLTLTEPGDLLSEPADRWSGRPVVVGVARRLDDEQIRWHTLAQGRLRQVKTQRQSQVDQQQLELIDEWSEKLDAAASTLWWFDHDAGLIAQPSGILRAGLPGNRSEQRHTVAGRQVYVLQEGGQPWTLSQALELLSALHAITLEQSLVPREQADAPLSSDVNFAGALERSLTDLLEPYGLVIQQRLSPIGSIRPPRYVVRPTDRGRQIDLRRTAPLSQADQRPLALAQQWIVRGAPQQIESTFTLTSGWDANLQGQPDSDYDRTTSNDFATYANVYRRWVLNEDAHFAGSAFDLSAFFNEGFIRPQPLRLGSCLTQDDSGVSRPVIVEISTDSGANWIGYPGQAIVLRNRAAVYLDDATLPATFFAAAKVGSAQVRATATLTSPQPVELARWRGNPFAGTQPPRLFTLTDTFAFRQVHEQSIHRNAIDLGTLIADEVDDSLAMHDWLIHRLSTNPNRSDTHTRIKRVGAEPEFRIGDRWATETIDQVKVQFAKGLTELVLTS